MLRERDETLVKGITAQTQFKNHGILVVGWEPSQWTGWLQGNLITELGDRLATIGNAARTISCKNGSFIKFAVIKNEHDAVNLIGYQFDHVYFIEGWGEHVTQPMAVREAIIERTEKIRARRRR